MRDICPSSTSPAGQFGEQNNTTMYFSSVLYSSIIGSQDLQTCDCTDTPTLLSPEKMEPLTMLDKAQQFVSNGKTKSEWLFFTSVKIFQPLKKDFCCTVCTTYSLQAAPGRSRTEYGYIPWYRKFFSQLTSNGDRCFCSLCPNSSQAQDRDKVD